MVGRVADADPGAAGVALLERTAERLLHDPIGGEVDADREVDRVALDGEVDRQSRGLRLAHERGDVPQRGLRGQRQLLVLAAQHAEQPADLGERLAAALLDGEERLAGAVRIALGQPPCA